MLNVIMHKEDDDDEVVDVDDDAIQSNSTPTPSDTSSTANPNANRKNSFSSYGKCFRSFFTFPAEIHTEIGNVCFD